jgi:hypothetical protein
MTPPAAKLVTLPTIIEATFRNDIDVSVIAAYR